jgi:hypothetical protein
MPDEFMGIKLLSHPVKLFFITLHKYIATSLKLNAHKTSLELA